MKKIIFLLIPLLLTSLVSSCAPVIFLLIPLLLTSLVSSCAPVTNDSRTVQNLAEINARRAEYAKSIQIEREKAQQEQREKAQQKQKEQEAKLKRFKEEWVEFIQSGEGSTKNKTTPEVKKLVDQWKRYRIVVSNYNNHGDLIETMDGHQVWKNIIELYHLESFFLENLEGFSLENSEIFSSKNFYKIFGKPWKTQFIGGLGILDLEDKYILWYTCEGGYAQITVRANAFDDGWIDILDLNIL